MSGMIETTKDGLGGQSDASTKFKRTKNPPPGKSQAAWMAGALPLGSLFQKGTDDFDHVTRSFLGGLCIPRHVIADMVLQKLPHQTMDRSARGGEPLQYVSALRILLERPLDGFDLPHDLLRAI